MANELIAFVRKQFAAGRVIEAELRLDYGSAGITVLFGPSGAGKTTLLRMLAGLERPDAGRIQFAEATWVDVEKGVFRPPQQRRIGYLFQEYALFPHLTVAQNIAYGLRALPSSERESRVSSTIQLLQLTGLERRFPNQISGGERQRVALARTLVVQPQLLLLDEPLSALDDPTREQLRADLSDLLRNLRIPSIVVTHDRRETLVLGEHMAVMIDGKIQQTGPVRDVVEQPGNAQIAQAVGIENIFPATASGLPNQVVSVESRGNRLCAPPASHCGQNLALCFRAEEVVIRRTCHSEAGGQEQTLSGNISSIVHEGAIVRVTVNCGFRVIGLLTRRECEDERFRVGDEVRATVNSAAIRVIPLR